MNSYIKNSLLASRISSCVVWSFCLYYCCRLMNKKHLSLVLVVLLESQQKQQQQQTQRRGACLFLMIGVQGSWILCCCNTFELGRTIPTRVERLEGRGIIKSQSHDDARWVFFSPVTKFKFECKKKKEQSSIDHNPPSHFQNENLSHSFWDFKKKFNYLSIQKQIVRDKRVNKHHDQATSTEIPRTPWLCYGFTPQRRCRSVWK